MNGMENGEWKMENEEDACIFVPKEVIDSFDDIFSLVKEARQEFIKVAEAMKPVELNQIT